MQVLLVVDKLIHVPLIVEEISDAIKDIPDVNYEKEIDTFAARTQSGPANEVYIYLLPDIAKEILDEQTIESLEKSIRERLLLCFPQVIFQVVFAEGIRVN